MLIKVSENLTRVTVASFSPEPKLFNKEIFTLYFEASLKPDFTWWLRILTNALLSLLLSSLLSVLYLKLTFAITFHNYEKRINVSS